MANRDLTVRQAQERVFRNQPQQMFSPNALVASSLAQVPDIAASMRSNTAAAVRQQLLAEAQQLASRGVDISGFERLAKSKTTNLKTLYAERRRIQQTLKGLDEQKKPKGLKKFALQTLDALQYPIEEAVLQPYYAAKQAQIGGESVLGQIRTFGAGLPGMGALASPNQERSYIRGNTYENRAALTAEGRLASFGETITGRAAKKLTGLTPQERRRLQGGIPTGWLPDQLSGGFDATLQIGGDPLNFGTPLMALARTAGIKAEGKLGLTLLDTATEAVIRNGTDTLAIRRAVPRMPTEAALRLQDAAQSGGRAEVRETLEALLREGVWNPDVAIRNRAAIGLGLRSTPGTSAVRTGGKLEPFSNAGTWLRQVARGTQPTATVVAAKTGHALRAAVSSTLTRAGTTEVDFYREFLQPQVAGLTKSQRVSRVTAMADSLDNAAAQNLAREVRAAVRANKPDAEKLLRRLEISTEMLAGDDFVAGQAHASLAQGLAVPKERLAKDFVKEASRNTGLGVKPAKQLPTGVPTAPGPLRTYMKARISAKLPDGELKTKLLTELDQATGQGTQALRDFAAVVEDAIDKPVLLDEMVRLGESGAARAAQAGDIATRPGLARRAIGSLLSVSERVAPGSIPFKPFKDDELNLNRRLEDADAYMLDLGLTDDARAQFRGRFAAVKSEHEIYRAIREVLTVAARTAGVDPKAILRRYDAKAREEMSALGFTVDADGNLIKGGQTLAQAIERIPVMEGGEFRQAVYEQLAAQGSKTAKLRSGIGKVHGNLLPEHGLIYQAFHGTAPAPAAVYQALGAAVVGGAIAEGDFEDRLKGAGIGAAAGAVGLRSLHKFWKMAIVANTPTVAAGAVAGGIGQFGDDDPAWERALKGAALGALAPTRYIMRVAGIEENLRKYMEGSFRAPEWVPFLAKWYRRRGYGGQFAAHEAVRAGIFQANYLSRPGLTTVGKDWIVVRQQDRRFLDSWYRVVNRQIHPESDFITSQFLQVKAGRLTKAQADKNIADFLKTADGKLHLKRAKGQINGPKNDVEMIQRYREFVDKYVPDARLAAARLDGDVTRDMLKTYRKGGGAPDFVHAQKTWIVPKNPRQLFATWQQMTSTLVFAGPTSRMNRYPMAEHFYAKEYSRLIDRGVDATRAHSIATEYAVERTNRVMFQISDESRFAAKADFVFPFQQPREELLRVWAKLIVQNPFKAAKVGRLAALAFNNGVENGTFRQDPYSGQWVMTYPGSAYISDRLFGFSSAFQFNLKDALFVGQGAYGMLPSPGGPFWSVASRVVIEAHPDLYTDIKENHPFLHGRLFPYDPSGKLLRNESNRLWMGLAGSVPPWEFAAGWSQEQEFKKWTREIALHLRYEKFKADPTTDPNWWPSDEKLEKATGAFFRAWSVLGSLSPAALRPLMPTRGEASVAIDAYKEKYGNDWYPPFVNENPGLVPFVHATRGYVGPDDYKHWTEQEEAKAEAHVTRFWEQRSLSEFKEFTKEAIRRSKAHNERRNIQANPQPLEREAHMMEWRRKYPDMAKEWNSSYDRDLELHTILTTYPQHRQDEAIDRWRQQFDVSNKEYKRLRGEVLRQFRVNPWRDARDTEEVADVVRTATRKGISEEVAIAELTPAEQARYWDSKMMDLDYYTDEDPKAVIDKYWQYKNRKSALFREHPELGRRDGGDSRSQTLLAKAVKLYQDSKQGVSDLWEEINRTTDAIERAKAAGQWQLWKALRAKRTHLHDVRRELINKAYRGLPELAQYQDDVRAVYALTGDKVKAEDIEAIRAAVGGYNIGQVLSWEEQGYLHAPPAVKQAMVDKLLNALDQEPFTKGKLMWPWLTDFQQDLLERNLPAEVIEEFKRDADDAQAKRGRYAKPQGGGGRRGGGGGGELDFAYELFEQYNQRPKGAKAPAAYKQYLALPKNPVVRADFLKKHPEVATWIKQGPMANMPEVYRYIVTNLMIKHGKWEGELRTAEEITDLSFAREQLKRWSRRGDRQRPATYDIWVNMPSGIEKAEYLKAHPEVKDWISLGPMSNMPEEYREVVRDIMQRYGEWTENTDPLGQTISQYYATPGYARDQFLREHPELLEYWSALRSPEENRMFALSDQYFSIQDPGARRMFLASQPELQQWFVEQRSKRYERFLNRVAQYMGGNPDLFTEYLERQNDILAELLRAYAEPTLVREVQKLTQADARRPSKTSEGGRRRSVSR